MTNDGSRGLSTVLKICTVSPLNLGNATRICFLACFVPLGSVLTWLEAAVDWVLDLVVLHPWLGYHLSLLMALQGRYSQSTTYFNLFLA